MQLQDDKPDDSILEPETVNELTETEKLYRRKEEQIGTHPDYTQKQKNSLLEQLALYPLTKMGTILTIVINMGLLQILRGSENDPSPLGIQYCSWQFFAFDTGIFSICILISLCMRGMIKKQHKYIVQELQQGNLVSFPLDQDRKVNKICFTALSAGFVGGMLGIGGGIIMTPVWLSMNINPQEVATTSILQVVISSATSSFTVFLSGKLDLINIAYFFTMALLGSLLISSLVRRYIEQNNKQSVLILILVIKISFALVILPLIFYYKYRTNQLPEFSPGNFC